jgi:hypothetical protein
MNYINYYWHGRCYDKASYMSINYRKEVSGQFFKNQMAVQSDILY